MKCFLWFHDWQIKKTWEHSGFYKGKYYPEEGARGWECRRCGKRKIKKVGGQWEDSCAIGPWMEAVDWMCEEVIH